MSDGESVLSDSSASSGDIDSGYTETFSTTGLRLQFGHLDSSILSYAHDSDLEASTVCFGSDASEDLSEDQAIDNAEVASTTSEDEFITPCSHKFSLLSTSIWMSFTEEFAASRTDGLRIRRIRFLTNLSKSAHINGIMTLSH